MNFLTRSLLCSSFASLALVSLMGVALGQNLPTLNVSTTSVKLNYTLQSEMPPTQTVMVTTSTGAAVEVGVSTVNEGSPTGFLAVTPVSCPATPCTFSVYAFSAVSSDSIPLLDKLAPNTYTAAFQLIGQDVTNNMPGNIPEVMVTLTVLPASPSPTVSVSPSSVSLSAQCLAAAAPADRGGVVALDETPAPCFAVPVTITVTNTGSESTELNVDASPGITTSISTLTVPPSNGGAATFTISANPSSASSSSGSFTGTVSLTPEGSSTPAATVSANVTVVPSDHVLVSILNQSGNLLPNSSGLTLYSSPDTLQQGLLLVPAGSGASYSINVTPNPTNGCPSGTVQAVPQEGALNGPTVVFLRVAVGLNPCTDTVTITITEGNLTTPYNIFADIHGEGTVNSAQSVTPSALSITAGGGAQLLLGGTGTATATGTGVTVTPTTVILPNILTVTAPQTGLGNDAQGAVDLTLVSNNGATGTLTVPVTVRNTDYISATCAPNGTWSLFFDRGLQSSEQGPLSGWCLNFSEVGQTQTVTLTGTSGTTWKVSSDLESSFSPLPSQIYISNIPGTMQSLELTLKSFASDAGQPGAPTGLLYFTEEGASQPALTLPLILNPLATVLSPTASSIEDLLVGPSSSTQHSDFFSLDFHSPTAGSYTFADSAVTVNPSTTTVSNGGSPPTGLAVIFNPGGEAGGFYVSTITAIDQSGDVVATAPALFNVPSSSDNYLTIPFDHSTGTFGTTFSTGGPGQFQFRPEEARAASSAVPSFTIPLGSSGSANQSYAAIGPSWLTLTPATGSTPQMLTASLNTAVTTSLPVGSYSGAITIAGSSAPYPLTVPVNLVVGTAPPVAVTNAASGLTGAVSPGEIVSIFGTNIGPATPAGLTLTSTGTVSTTLGKTQVLFDGVPAPLTYAGSGQINAVVPYEVVGELTTYMTVMMNGNAVGAANLAVTDSVPALVALSGGTGQGVIVNQDGSINGPKNPAAAGTVITLYGTGEGMLVPAVATGSVTSSTGPTFPAPVQPVSLTIGGQGAEIQYAGEAPGFVSGVLQVNAVVPAIPSGPETVVLTVGNGSNASQNITVSVK